MIDNIVFWRITVRKWEIYSFDFNITHEEVLDICNQVNKMFEEVGSDLRVRKSWKVIEACDEEDSL